MGGAGDPEPIEIELTSDGAEPSPFARHGDLDRAAAPTARSDQRLRGVVSTVVVGLLALAFGWVIGRSTVDGERNATSATTTTLVRTNLIEPIAPVATLPPSTTSIAATTTTTPPTTTTLPARVPPARGAFLGSAVAVAESVADQAIQILAVGNAACSNSTWRPGSTGTGRSPPSRSVGPV